ncbi:MAG: hydantoinase/oxoprolinase family protein [Dehalococcoidia bacterium]|nr:hydantoinase/oxoprolinase family protein [Dehalococcoidia bacterium]
MARTLLGIDTGGTFTDFVLLREGRVTVFKTRSTPSDPSLASVEGIRALETPPDAEVVHGTTVATNALLQRRGARTAVVTTAGFEDLLQIGRQARSDLYALEYEAPVPLAPAELRLGVAERVGADGAPALALTEAEAERVAREVRKLGAEAVAVSLVFSFLRPEHERMLGDALARQDSLFVSLSSDVLPEFREYERTSTVTVNAYVGPVMDGYLRRLEEGAGRKVTIMQSSGGSAPVGLTRAHPVRTILSGPAGGVIGARMVAEAAGYREIMTLDMGGTSTDVSLCPGEAQMSTGHSVGGLPIGVPAIDIETVGAGGGSIARLDRGGALRVGPESAGADPGPACYGVGEEPTVTDANLVLGRMSPDDFLGGRAWLDVGRAQAAIDGLASAGRMSREEAAAGVVRVANAVMERAMRAVSLERGFDPRDFALVAFGGAGPQHACELAEALDIATVFVDRRPGVLSALGAAAGDTIRDYSRTVMARQADDASKVEDAFAALEALGKSELAAEGIDPASVRVEQRMDARYVGQSYELALERPEVEHANGLLAAVAEAFHAAHGRRFGYSNPNAPVEVVNARVRAVVAAEPLAFERRPRVEGAPQPRRTARAWFDGGWRETPVYAREDLAPGHAFEGPALVAQMDSTTVAPPGWAAEVDELENIILTRKEGR